MNINSLAKPSGPWTFHLVKYKTKLRYETYTSSSSLYCSFDKKNSFLLIKIPVIGRLFTPPPLRPDWWVHVNPRAWQSNNLSRSLSPLLLLFLYLTPADTQCLSASHFFHLCLPTLLLACVLRLKERWRGRRCLGRCCQAGGTKPSWGRGVGAVAWAPDLVGSLPSCHLATIMDRGGRSTATVLKNGVVLYFSLIRSRHGWPGVVYMGMASGARERNGEEHGLAWGTAAATYELQASINLAASLTTKDIEPGLARWTCESIYWSAGRRWGSWLPDKRKKNWQTETICSFSLSLMMYVTHTKQYVTPSL